MCDVTVNVPEHIVHRLKENGFVDQALQDRVQVFGQALKVLTENGWSENEIQWAKAALGAGGYASGGAFAPPHRVAHNLEDAAELTYSPGDFDVSEDRFEELVQQVEERSEVASALIFATRDFGAIESPIELQNQVTLRKDHTSAGVTRDREVVTTDHHLVHKNPPHDAAPQTEIEIASARTLTRDEWISELGPEVVATQMQTWLTSAADDPGTEVPASLARKLQYADEADSLEFEKLEELFWSHYPDA